jgi:hypothetical protein
MIWDQIHKPNFFLVGAAKSGTTSMSSWLSQHPDVYVSPIKEPNFFSTDIDPNRFRKSYRSTLHQDQEAIDGKGRQVAFIRDEELYAELFRPNAGTLAAGDCSTSYLFSKDAAQNIHIFNPEAKIIMLLRNPVERAFSHYTMAVQMGLEKGDFHSAFKRDRKRIDKGWGISELYYELGEYAKQYKRFASIFNPNQIKVVLFDDWQRQPKETQESICKFLNVSIFAGPENEALNQGVNPKFPFIHRMLMKSGIKDFAKGVLPEKWFTFFKQGQYKAEKSVLASEDRKMLRALYKDEILELQQLIKRDLSNWLK